MDNNGAAQTWYVVVEDPANSGLPAILDQVTGRRVDSASAFVTSMAERGLRPATITVYVHAICGFLQFCSANPREKGHRGTTLGRHLQRYIVGLALEEERDHLRRDLPARSPARERTRLRTLFNTLVRYLEYRVAQETPPLDDAIPSWHEVQQAFADACARRGMGPVAAKLPMPQTVRATDSVISEPELRSVVALTDERAGLAIMLFYYLGLDARRAVTLRCRDIRVDRGSVTVATRSNNRKREIEAFVLPASTALFIRLLSRVPAVRSQEAWLFPSREPTREQCALSADDLQRLVIHESARVGRRVSTHQLQIWGAAEALRKGESMDAVVKRLGHKALRSELRKAVDVLSSPNLFPRMNWTSSRET
ncbi:MAG: tyrosine-type recombinase/integrase [Candidatus Cryosericum sp.]